MGYHMTPEEMVRIEQREGWYWPFKDRSCWPWLQNEKDSPELVSKHCRQHRTVIQAGGNVDQTEMYRTLNCGVGMVICVPGSEADKAIEILSAAGEEAWLIGSIANAAAGDEQVELAGMSH